MPIYLHEGKILTEGGKIAVSEDCCCEKVGDCEEWVGTEFFQNPPPEVTVQLHLPWLPFIFPEVCPSCLGMPPNGWTMPLTWVNESAPFFSTPALGYGGPRLTLIGVVPDTDFIYHICHEPTHIERWYFYTAWVSLMCRRDADPRDWQIAVDLGTYIGRSGATPSQYPWDLGGRRYTNYEVSAYVTEPRDGNFRGVTVPLVFNEDSAWANVVDLPHSTPCNVLNEPAIGTPVLEVTFG